MRPIATAGVVLLVLVTACAGGRPGIRTKGGASPEGEPGVTSAFAELDWVLEEREQAIAEAARSLQRSLVFQYRDAILGRTLPVLRALRVDAGIAARAGRADDAGARYQAALVVTQMVMLEVNLVTIGDHADQAGQNPEQIVSHISDYDEAMYPLLAAAMTLNPYRLAAALPEGARKYSEWVDFANRWGKAVGIGAKISERTILVLDGIMVVLAVRQLAVLAAKGVAGGGGPPLVPMPSGAIAATRLDVFALARLYEAIQKLVAAGAMDPVVLSGLAAFAGAAARPELNGPVAWAMQGVNPPLASAAPPSSAEPGRWNKTKESMSDRAAAYQEQQTGRTARIWEYRIGDVSFDGFENGKAIEVKGPGYAQWLKLDGKGDLKFSEFFEGAQAMHDQLERHSRIAARGIPVEWRIAEPRLAEYLRKYVQDAKLNITVVHVHPK
jgi:hypothetical protein